MSAVTLTLALSACSGADERSTGTPPRESAGRAAAPALAPRPKGRWPGVIAYASEGPATRLDVYVRDGPEKPRRLTRGPRDEFSPAWSRDGRRIAYRVNPTRGDEGEIWTMSADGAGKRNLTRSPKVADWSPAFSPDGRRIAYMSMVGGSPELWTMRSDGKGKRQLTNARELSEYPSWSPDGRELTFGGFREGDFEILSIPAAGGRERNLSNNPGRDQWPAWSPSGDLIAFMSDRDGGDDVFVMRTDGTRVRNVTKTPELHETHPAWTPDGRLSFLQHGESGPVHVRIVDPAGGAGYNLPVDAVFVFGWAAF